MLPIFLSWMLLSHPAGAQQSEMLSLNGTWQFELAANEAAADTVADFYKVDYKAAGFQPTPVPSNWALQGFEPPHYKPFNGDASQGFYLRHFNVPASFSGKRILLHFGGVWSSAEVWLNGKPLGRHDSGFTSFAYDITSHLNPQGDNLLAVRVRQVQHDYLFDTNDDWSLGGIYRDVTLEAVPGDRYLDRVDVQTTFDSQFHDSDLGVRVMVGDHHKKLVPGNIPDGPGDPYDLRLTLLDQSGHEVQSQQIAIHAHYGTGRETSTTFHVISPLPWTADTPNLYTVKVTLLEGGKPSHERTKVFGFRQISTSGGIFRVNGQAIKLRGVDRHDEYPDVGRATTPANWLQDITLMKAANINFIRTSHYPPAEGFLDLCDKMGMYVEDEVPMGFGGDNAADPSYAAAVMLRSYETVSRDLDHPSVIMWSIGNEDPLTSLHMASIRTVKGLDPTRPVLMPWRSEEWLPKEIDILAPHYLTAQDSDELAAHSTRPVMASEYTHAYGEEGFGGLEDRWNAMTRHASGAGGAIWMWADQGLKVTKKNADGTTSSSLLEVDDGIDGIVGSYREPQRDYWETKAVYAPVFPEVDAVSFTPGQASVRIPIQNDFDFLDLKNVKIAWAVMEDAKELASGTATVEGKAHATAWLDVPIDGIRTARAGSTYYIRLTFSQLDGSEITKRSVELRNAGYVAPAPSQPQVAVRVEQADRVTVISGDTTYVFDPHTGQLTSATLKGAARVTDLRPTIWHPLHSSEASIARKDTDLQQLPDLNRYQAFAREWHVAQKNNEVHIQAAVDYKVDDKDHFSVQYEYIVGPDGILRVHYSVAPTVQVHWLPQIGMQMELASDMTRLQWLGLGPLDAFPNEKAATMLGVWGGATGSNAVTGNKGTRWIDVSGTSGGVHIANNGYMRTEAERPQHLEALSLVVGRTSKGRRPETPEQQLNTDDAKQFAGELTLSLHP